MRGACFSLTFNAMVVIHEPRSICRRSFSRRGDLSCVLEWDSDDMLELLDRSTGELVEEWHTAIGEGWNGVQVLDVKEVWMPLEPIETEALQRQWRPKKGQPWTWSVLSNSANGRLMGRGALVAHKEGQWQKLVRMEAILGASPVATNRTSRNWPLQSVLAEGTWHSLATVEEGVHCIGYDELVGLAVASRSQSG